MTTISFPQPAPLMSLNDRQHWAARAELTRRWRTAAYYATVAALPGKRDHGPTIVTVELPVRDSRRRDPSNYVATVKPIVDGLVDAGVWPDDDGSWVATSEPVLVVGGTRVVVRLEPRQVVAA